MNFAQQVAGLGHAAGRSLALLWRHIERMVKGLAGGSRPPTPDARGPSPPTQSSPVGYVQGEAHIGKMLIDQALDLTGCTAINCTFDGFLQVRTGGGKTLIDIRDMVDCRLEGNWPLDLLRRADEPRRRR